LVKLFEIYAAGKTAAVETFLANPASLGGRRGTAQQGITFPHRGQQGTAAATLRIEKTGLTLQDHAAVFMLGVRLALRVKAVLGVDELTKVMQWE
jgi:hypothetical protein